MDVNSSIHTHDVTFSSLCCILLDQTLAECRMKVCKALGLTEEQCELSMGMSSDFEQAVSDAFRHLVDEMLFDEMVSFLSFYYFGILSRTGFRTGCLP